MKRNQMLAVGAAIAALIVVAVGSFLSNRPSPAVAPGGVGGGLSVSTTASQATVKPTSAAAPASAPSTIGEDSGKPVDVTSNPPAGVSAAEAQLAQSNAVKYWQTINKYGAIDTAIGDHVTRAWPLMSPGLQEVWSEVRAEGHRASDVAHWQQLHDSGKNNEIIVTKIVVFSSTKDTITFAATYRSGVIAEGEAIPTANPVREVRIVTVRTGGQWLVDSATAVV